ncbi:hypothetical protein HID58_013546 [Brassica napus]|uniref:S-locus glycoprotein n=1 Tax=Brassica napus TaxID=3708 RepID=A0ABQ8E495_BRANA|nr:hypothetical protein HID58_013546 [Brassica napus]
MTMNTSSPLSIGQTLSSPGGFYELGFFTPNNTRNLYVGIWFKKIVPRVVVWVANRDTLVTNSPANPNISINGSLILLDGEQDAFTSNKCHAELQDTENLVVIDDVSRTTIWQSFKNIGDTMLPHSSLMYDLSHVKKRRSISWEPLTRDYTTGPWVKTRFTGFTQFEETYVSPFTVVQDLATSTGSVSYYMLRNFNLSYNTLTSEGEMKIYWDQGKKWMHHLTEPEHPCDLYGTCGPFGLCVRSSTPKCICMKGFVPKSDEEWRRRNWTSGCANSQAKETDGFYLWNGKLVDTVQFLSNGETLSLRLARLELAESSQAKIIVGTAASLSIFVILVVAAYMLWIYKNGENGETMHTIQTATNNFSPSNELGQGGFGPVYKGNLLDEKEIAVKHLSSRSGQGTEEFMNEIT